MDEHVKQQVRELRFLVVEDQGFQRWEVEHLLKGLGATHIFSAGDGQEALELFRTVRPAVDVILTDLNMPGMDGIEFIRRVVETRTPVSFILVSEQDATLIGSVAAMTQAYGAQLLEALRKPLTATKLAGALERYRKPIAPANDRAIRHSFTLAEIDEGIAADEFEPCFQAKVDLSTGELQGAEALARWRHPYHGTVMPLSFIGALEDGGRIDALTRVIMKKSAAACKAWRKLGKRATVSVNLSLSSLEDVTLADRLAATVEKAGLEPRDMVLEVTETAAASHMGHVLENLARARLMGFGLAIDDYGTGYSSMQQLERIAFTELKIDQSFVRGALGNHASRAVLESSLEIARKLGIHAVAEGVESEAELRLLRQLGCPEGQGYLLGRPLWATDFEAWLKAGARTAVSQ